jgi:hypothetical protein
VEVTIQFRKKGTWSSRFDACICCGTKKKKHFAKGLCEACYGRAYRDAVKVRKKKNWEEAQRMIDAD